VVLDPFGGSGTMAVAAHFEKMHFLVFEKDPRFFEMANKNYERAANQLTMF
jgi:DNA modification methylase